MFHYNSFISHYFVFWPSALQLRLCPRRIASSSRVHMTLDTWHVTRDKWHMTHDMWNVPRGGGWAFSQNVSALALTVWETQCFEDISTKDHWVHQVIMGLLITADIQGYLYIFWEHIVTIINFEFYRSFCKTADFYPRLILSFIVVFVKQLIFIPGYADSVNKFRTLNLFYVNLLLGFACIP